MIFTRSETEIAQIMKEWLQCVNSGEAYGFGRSKAIFLDRDWRPELGFPLAGIYDNDPALVGRKIRGLPILPVDELRRRGGKIIVFASDYMSIRGQLTGLGLKEDYDFLPYNDLISLYMFYQKNLVFLGGGVGLVPTTHCTLNCLDCTNSIDKNRCRQHFSVTEIASSLKLLFERVHLVRHLGLVGGEPLLYPELAGLVEHIGQNYPDRYLSLIVITNGTIAPAADLLRAMGRYRGEFFISDYREAGIAGYAEKFDRTLSTLKENGLPYVIGDSNWQEYICDDGELANLSPGELIAHYNQCVSRARCVSLVETEKLYYCQAPWFAEQSGRAANISSGYLALGELKPNDPGDRLRLIRFYLGHCVGGYLPFCRYCRGQDPAYYLPAPKARQAQPKQ